MWMSVIGVITMHTDSEMGMGGEGGGGLLEIALRSEVLPHLLLKYLEQTF